MRSGLADILAFSQQVPNWAPNERFLPNADYGRIGALKLVNNVFVDKIINYLSATTGTTWGTAGAYHYYLLGRNLARRRNEHERVGLAGPPQSNSFRFGNWDPAIERDGPLYFSRILEEIAETARVYGFSMQTLASAILTTADGLMTSIADNSNAATNVLTKDGFQIAKNNWTMLESLWGIRASGYPATFQYQRGVAARKDYGGYSKGRKGKKKRRRYR